MIKNLIFSIITACLLSGCVIREGIKTNEADWLVGTWENRTARGSLYETWRKISATEFSGTSYTLREKDTVVFENIQLIKRNNVLHYIPTVNGQNNNTPISFALKEKTEQKLVFENLSHDFPQVISYTRISSDSLFAEISGTTEGKIRKQGFGMKKIN